MTLPTGLGGLLGFIAGVLLARGEERFAAWRRRMRRDHRLHAQRIEKLAQARSVLAAVTRYPHDMDHVQRIVKEAIRETAVDKDED